MYGHDLMRIKYNSEWWSVGRVETKGTHRYTLLYTIYANEKANAHIFGFYCQNDSDDVIVVIEQKRAHRTDGTQARRQIAGEMTPETCTRYIIWHRPYIRSPHRHQAMARALARSSSRDKNILNRLPSPHWSSCCCAAAHTLGYYFIIRFRFLLACCKLNGVRCLNLQTNFDEEKRWH